MNFLKRAMLAVVRRKGKTIIMFVIFAAIANLVLAGFAIQQATENASVLARQKLGGKITLRYDSQRAMQNARASGTQRIRIQTEPITEDMVKAVSSQKNILDYNYFVNASGMADGFEPVVTQQDEQQNDSSNNGPNGGNQFFRQGISGQGMNIVIPDVSIIGVTSSQLSDDFDNGSAKIIEGRQITRDDVGKKVAIVEKNLADQNSLKVGSKIKVKSTRTDDTVEFQIVGIYQSQSSGTSSEGPRMGNMPFTEPYNRIYVDYESAIPLKTMITDSGTTTGGIDSAVFFIDDPKNIDTAVADIKAMNIDWEKYTIDANDYAYQQMMGPIENVASFSKTVVYIVAIAGAVILALILMLFIKERMYETGVLLSMGEGKFKVISQYVAEVLIIAIVAFGLSAFSSTFTAQGIGSMLLDRELKVVQEQSTNVGGFSRDGGFGQGGQFRALLDRRYPGGAAGNVEAIDSLDIKITLEQIGKASAAGLIIIILGTILPAATVMRYKPKTILTKAT